MAMFSNGIVLNQHKEPALSQKMVRLLNPHKREFELSGGPITGDLPEAAALIDIIEAAGITDERDGSLLHEALRECVGTGRAMLIDAVDDEPYVSSKLGPMLQMQEELLGGVEICRHICDTKNINFLVYKHLTDIESHIPAKIGGYPVVKLRGGYPATPSVFQLRRLGRENKLVVSVGALIRVYRAVRQGVRQNSSFITVAGNCVAKPVNMEVSFGISITQVVERVGLIDEPTRIVSGGPMRGFAVVVPDKTVVMPTTRAVLAIRQSKSEFYSACVGCGRCEQICPMGLNPAYIHRLVQNGYYSQLKRFDAHMCIGCGTCSYICPSRLDVVESTERAKAYAEKHFIEKTGGEEKQNAG